MSWQIAADMREMITEISATNGHQTFCLRGGNRKDQMLSGFIELLSQLPTDFNASDCDLQIRTDLHHVLVREDWGAPAAFFATEGFETMLEIGDQTRKNPFGLHPDRDVPIVAHDLSFGVTERTRADGTIEINLDEKEIDFVLSKLSLSDVKSCAICFLHSDVNPQHENQLAKTLKEKGYHVVCSSQFVGNELARARQAAVQAVTAPEILKIKEDLVKHGFSEERIAFVENWTSRKSTDGDELHISFLEDQIQVLCFQKDKSPNRYTLPIHFLTAVHVSEAGFVQVGPDRIDSEPGPVCLGKGLKLCVFDLLVHAYRISSENISRFKIDPARVTKILSGQSLQLKIPVDDCARSFVNLFFEKVAAELIMYSRRQNTDLKQCSIFTEGFLADFVPTNFADFLESTRFQRRANSQWIGFKVLESKTDQVFRSGELARREEKI